MRKKYFVIVPVFNETKHIRKCVESIKKYHQNIIVVNDGSSDNTGKILDSMTDLQVIHLEKNSGKGNAMKVGAKAAWKMGAKGIIFMDGDNQHNPKHINEFVKHLSKGRDIVIGVRMLKTDIPLYRKIGNLLMVFVMHTLFSIKIVDMMCGYRAFSKRGYRQVLWESSGYEVETEVLTKIGQKKLNYSTVVVDTIYHDKYKGFSMLDGIKIMLKFPGWKLKNI